MKILLFIFPALVLMSCTDHRSYQYSDINKQDTTSSDSAIVQNDSLPGKSWYLTEIEKVLPQWTDSSLSVASQKKINAKVFSVLCNHSDGVSNTTYLFTFSNNKLKDYAIIEDGHDQDLSSSSYYEYKELRHSTDNKFVVVSYIQSVNDKSVLTTNGEFKTGFNFENVKIKEDSILITLSILNDGLIKRDSLKY